MKKHTVLKSEVLEIINIYLFIQNYVLVCLFVFVVVVVCLLDFCSHSCNVRNVL